MSHLFINFIEWLNYTLCCTCPMSKYIGMQRHRQTMITGLSPSPTTDNCSCSLTASDGNSSVFVDVCTGQGLSPCDCSGSICTVCYGRWFACQGQQRSMWQCDGSSVVAKYRFHLWFHDYLCCKWLLYT